ncbi:MAG TPA: protoporphyrinogen oxidase [Acidimicrobiales bacterium]|nr:protoporphyrinogen oxidase [Acidimicrobiales bacterium]
MTCPQVTVVGGGITGMAAAWELVRSGASVTLLEASPRLGGKIAGEQIAGRWVELGPDAFLARLPEAVRLCSELGLEHELVGAATESASIWANGRLRPIPTGTVLGAPAGLAGLRAVALSGLLSPAGLARAGLDLVLPRRRLGDDPSVGALITSRFGRQVHERLVDPIVGGIHAGPSSRLSCLAVAPQLLAGARSRRSLLLGLESSRRSAHPPEPSGTGATFVSLRGGLARLVGRLEEALRDAGSHIELGHEVQELPTSGSPTILTTPAPVTAALLAGISPAAAAELAELQHASVALAVLRYPLAAFPGGAVPGGSGFLAPSGEGRLLTACSFGSSKWPHWAAPLEVVLRISAGRWGDGRAMALDDRELVRRLHGELVEALELTAEPIAARVARWPAAFPQYRPGHLDKVARIEAALRRDCPRIHVAGAAYRGVGIPACIGQGRAAARRVLGL